MTSAHIIPRGPLDPLFILLLLLNQLCDHISIDDFAPSHVVLASLNVVLLCLHYLGAVEAREFI